MLFHEEEEEMMEERVVKRGKKTVRYIFKNCKSLASRVDNLMGKILVERMVSISKNHSSANMVDFASSSFT